MSSALTQKLYKDQIACAAGARKTTGRCSRMILPSTGRGGAAGTNSCGGSVNSISSSEKSIAYLAPTAGSCPPNERLQRSRERNRIHARKTRQRKKEQMMTLTQRADGLKSEQIRLMQCINEKTTASILVGLFASDALAGDQQQVEDPRIEALLRRPSDDIPDAAMLPELPALILPGQHNSKKMKSSGSESQITLPDDGIDYDLLGKDRSKCSVAELDKIRRERNRMHAKRTRDRKRFFMEEMAEMCQQLEDENRLLQSHLDSLNGEAPADRAESVISPSMSSVAPTEFSMPSSTSQTTPLSFRRKVPVSPNGTTFDQISTLLEAAGAFSSAISDSSSTSQEESHDSDRDDEPRYKRRRLQEYHPQEAPQNVPSAITTSSATAVGC